MARIVKEYDVRRDEILDTGLKLILTKGYEQMTIRDILEELQISNGAFYHYFDSKQSLLAALSDRMQEDALKLLKPVIENPDLSALDKFEKYFTTASRWKSAQKEYLMALLRVWYADNNALFREKIFAGAAEQITPLLTKIIIQGYQEGAFTVTYPEHVGRAVMALVQNLWDSLAKQLLSLNPDPDEGQRTENLRQLKNTVAAYSEAIERVLGAPKGSMRLADEETIRLWL